MKYWFLLLIVLFLSKSPSRAQDNAMLICTDHRNELAAHGFTHIFEHNGKYCVVIADNSMEVLNEVFEWLNSSIGAMFVPSENEDTEEWIKRREKEKEQGLLDEFINWSADENFNEDTEISSGPAHGDENVEEWIKRREKEKEQGLLDELVNWSTGENFSGDTDRYGGPAHEKAAGKIALQKEVDWLEGMFNFWNVD